MDDVEKVKAKIDIVELIESYIPLKKAGRNFKSPCPFHNEKSPSFVVSPDRQIWHCFGCNKGGDIFTFVEEYEKTTFSDALKFLAQKAGVKLTVSAARSEAEKKREMIYGLNLLAAQFYEYILFQHKVGISALKYVLDTRNQPEKLLKTFQVGYAPSSGTALTQFLLKKKQYAAEDIIEAGLAFRNGGRLVDFFRHRIMFPITDPRGNIIAFSGRALEPDQMPKYVNTRETAVYTKGQTVFGLNLAREAIKKEGTVIVMEGEFDVISAHREGIGNVVAVKGTALTAEQIDLLRRYAQKIVFCFDTDPAGTSAQRRSIQMIENSGVVASVIVLPKGKDPDELLNTNPYDFKQAVKKDVHIYDFVIDSAVSQHDRKTVEGKRAILSKTIPFLAVIDNEVIKEHYLKKLATELDSSYDAVIRQVEKEKKEKKEVISVTSTKKTREEVVAQYLFSLLFQSQKLLEHARMVDNAMQGISFLSPVYDKLFLIFKKEIESNPEYSAQDIARVLPAELLPSFDAAYLSPLPEFDEKTFEIELKKAAIDLKTLSIKKRLYEITREVEKLEEAHDEKQIEHLQKEANELTMKLKTVS